MLSHFNFCSSVYAPCLDAADVYRIQKVQNSCLRLMYNIRRRDHITPYLKRSGWLNMSNRFSLRMCCFYYKILKFKSPPYLYNRIRFRTDVHHLNLRRRNILTIPRHKKQIFKRSFSYNIAHSINGIHGIEHFGTSLSLSSFRKKLKGIIMLNQ